MKGHSPIPSEQVGERAREEEHTRAVLDFDRLSDPPYRNGLIYYPKGIVKEVKE